MRIFSFDYPPADGGIARLCAEFATHLHKRGQEVEVIAQYSDKENVFSPYNAVPTTRLRDARPQREVAAWAKLQTSKDLLISGIVYPEGLVGMLSAPEKHVILAHGNELLPHPNLALRGIWKQMKRHVLESASLVIANSYYTQYKVSQLAPMAPVAALPLAVDHERFSPTDQAAARAKLGLPDDKIIISTVARVQKYKAHDLVIDALASLDEDEQRQLVYVIAGKGPELDALKQRAHERGVADQIIWLGFVAEEDLASVYNASNLFVLCTRDNDDDNSVEGFGLVFLEAQACGVPVIGARTGGIPDAVDEGNGGWLIDQDDVDALCEHLRTLARSPDVFREQGRLARERVEQGFTWRHYTDNFLALLETHDLL